MGKNHLEMRLKNRLGQTVVTHQYSAYPLRLSGAFRLDSGDPNRAYLYMTNTSPGLLAGDNLGLSVQLEAGGNLYLTDQAATKIHAMPKPDTKATVHWKIEVGDGASLEFVPEPLILFADAALEQKTSIQLHSNAQLFWSEIILPGRLARGEKYEFRHYFSRVKITSETQEIWFRDNIRLEGKGNLFKHSELFSSESILANIIIVQPQINLDKLDKALENIETANPPDLTLARSILPENRGLIVRVLAGKTSAIKTYIKSALNSIRTLSNRPNLPHIPK